MEHAVFHKLAPLANRNHDDVFWRFVGAILPD
ncbi:hypothetical protein JKG68_07635 [Microvirga aerilata]|uniref:Uncharacterized protein n=1 Tax=Microvirga aerilata TaxID=670292 RepID=A0A937D181_9HYPH|nr:hypothetical protein [Microvirga aerilata]